ncbi:MAG TPA: hypothetical protein VFG69_06215 [Nannocystaceae bacterium]|nr:hypothetical protein [Nannocystaceae bacterium]
MSCPRPRARRVRGAAALALPLLVAARSAHAGEGDVPFLGNEAAISGGAVVAAGRSAAMAWSNPAGLGANEHGHLEASGQLFMLRLRRIPAGLSTELPDATRSTPMRSRELFVVPSATVIARRLGRRTNAAIALFVPSFDEIDIDVHSQGTTPATRYAQQIKVVKHQRRYHFGPAFGWEVVPDLRLGFAAFVIYDKNVQNVSTWARASTLEIPPTTERFVQNDLQESVRTWGAELVVGLQWQPLDYLHLGLAFRSPRVWFASDTDRGAVTSVGGHNPTQGGFADQRAVPELDTSAGRADDPLQITGAIAYAWARGWVSFEGELRAPRGGSVDEGRKLVLNARLGVRARVGKRLVLGGGLYTDRSALVVADDFLDFDVDSYGATFGGELRRTLRLGKNEQSRRIVFTTAVAVRYGISIGRAGRMLVDLSELGAFEREALVTTGDPVDVRMHDLALHVGSGLQF